MEAHGARARIEGVRRSARTERALARAPRYIGIAFLCVTSFIGVREIVASSDAAPPPPAAEASADPAAENFALQFARAYLTYDAARPESRERELRAFLSDELDPDAGLVAERGEQTVRWAQVAQSEPREKGGRTVVVAAGTDAQRVPLYLAVGVERDATGALRLAGYPALVGPPIVNHGARSEDREDVEEAEISATAKRVVANYISGQERDLRADLAPDAAISLPTMPLRLGAVDELVWADGSERSVIAEVQALDEARNAYALAYELGLERRRGRVYATYIQTVPTQ